MEPQVTIYMRARKDSTSGTDDMHDAENDESLNDHEFLREVVFRFKFPVKEVVEKQGALYSLVLFDMDNNPRIYELQNMRVLEFKGDFYHDHVVIAESLIEQCNIVSTNHYETDVYVYTMKHLLFYELNYNIWISEEQMNAIFDTIGDEFSLPGNDRIHKLSSLGKKFPDFDESRG